MRQLAEWQMKDSHLLFEGVVENIEIRHGVPGPVPDNALSATPSADQILVTLKATKVYRGAPAPVFNIATAVGPGSCGFEFENGKSYLVDASYNSPGTLVTTSCDHTMALQSAAPQLRALRGEPVTADDLLTPKEYRAKHPPDEDAQICGRITRQDGSPLGKTAVGSLWRVLNSPVQPEKYADLHIESDGKYCTDLILPGKYIVGAVDGQPWKTGIEYRGYFRSAQNASRATAVEIKAGQKVTDASFALTAQKVYTITGRVMAQSTAAPDFADLRVLLRTEDNELLTDVEDTAIDSDGTFEFYQVPAGRYVLSLEDENGLISFARKSTSSQVIVVPEQARNIILPVLAK